MTPQQKASVSESSLRFLWAIFNYLVMSFQYALFNDINSPFIGFIPKNQSNLSLSETKTTATLCLT